MKQYLWNYKIYMIIAAVFTALYSLVVHRICWGMLPISLVTLYLLRVMDDSFDYETDTKDKPLSRKKLWDLVMILALLFVVLHVIFFGLWGLLSILMLVYLYLMQKWEILKLFLLTLLTAFYLWRYIGFAGTPAWVYLAVILTVSVGFHIYKTGMRDE